LSSQGFENIEDTISMFSKDKGPLNFKLLELNHSSDYYQFYRDLAKISKNDLKNLSDKIRKSHNIHPDDLVVIVSPKSLETPTEKFNTPKDWYSYYYERTIVVKTGGWEKITEGKPYLGISHQIIENIFQFLGNIDLYSKKLEKSVHLETEVCINDFCANINETKGKIRSGYICQSCIESSLKYISNDYVIQIKNILSRISNRVRENYVFDFSEDQLKIEVIEKYKPKNEVKEKYNPKKEVIEKYKIKIGGQIIEFGKKGKLYHVAYLFYLINPDLGIGSNDLSKQGIVREKFKSLYVLIYKNIYDYEIESYIKNITSIHSRISTKLKNQLSIESLAHKYGFKSKKISQDVSVYNIDLSKEHLILPPELNTFKISI
jgi:translation initiation factor IF-1